ncbi:MAG: CCA tRNA nucleotidyltransferase [Sulfuricurvum sp.]
MTPPPLQSLVDHLIQAGITPIFVGGYVRDSLLDLQSYDIDIELYGIHSSQELIPFLKPFGNVCEVGKSYGVVKLYYSGFNIDFSLPRTETKTSLGHRGFEVQTYSELDFATAARRRDFTINTIGYNPITDTILDPYGGEADLVSKTLRCVDPKTFIEDPLRVLRAVQFAARFDLVCEHELLLLCQSMIAKGALEELPKERIFEEIKKLLLLAPKPSIGFELLREMGGLTFFKELSPLESTPQDPLSHPEGSVWTHTMMALDVMATNRSGDAKRDLIHRFAILLHDSGKPYTTIVCNGILNASKHAQAGVEIARTFLERITNEKELIERVLPLVYYHGFVRKLFKIKADDGAIRHLSTHIIIDDLIPIARADFFGREFHGEKPKQYEAGEWLYKRATKLGVLTAPPPALFMGRDLIVMGLKPSKEFHTIISTAYNAQLDGLFFTKSAAILWVKNYLNVEQ